MKEEWTELDEFPGFVLSNYGEIVNLKTRKSRRIARNAQGIAMFTTYVDDRFKSRAVAKMVAEAFILNDNPIFNTPINLDGDRMNCRADNLMWRPRWFAIRYHRQFQLTQFRFSTYEISLPETGESFVGFKDPCVKYGIHYFDIIKSIEDGRRIFPTLQRFVETKSLII